MPSSVNAGLCAINDHLLHLFEETRRSLAGQREFDLDLVQDLSALISQADPVVRRARALRVEDPEFAAPLDHYLHLAQDLRCELEKVNMMLLARRSALHEARTQLHAVTQWTSALSSTR
jgi:hypothetical protein